MDAQDTKLGLAHTHTHNRRKTGTVCTLSYGDQLLVSVFIAKSESVKLIGFFFLNQFLLLSSGLKATKNEFVHRVMGSRPHSRV